MVGSLRRGNGVSRSRFSRFDRSEQRAGQVRVWPRCVAAGLRARPAGGRQIWVQHTYPELRARACKHGAKIFFLDEAGFSSEPNLGRTYGLKGQTPVVPTTDLWQKINAISAIHARGEFWCKDCTGKLNAGLFVEFLNDFMRGRTYKVYLVVGGHPGHKANVVKEYVQSTVGRLELRLQLYSGNAPTRPANLSFIAGTRFVQGQDKPGA